MKVPPTLNETQRLRILREYAILDTPPEKDFDDITALAATICETPVAVISLIDEDRLWFKSKLGIALEQTPREETFCAHAMAARKLLEVSDALVDPSFARHPLVTGEPHIRFYAGAPLITESGAVLGNLCVVDLVPRQLNERQKSALDVLCRQVMAQMELRKSQKAHQVLEERWQMALSGSDLGVWDWNAQTDEVYYSERWCSMLGYTPEEISPRLEEWSSRVHPDDLEPTMTLIREHLEGRSQIYISEHRVRTKDGSYRWNLDRGKVISWDANGKALRVVGTHTDITERRKGEEQLRLLESCVSRMNDIVLITEAQPIDEPGPRILYVNEAFVRRTGYTREEILGRSPRFLQGPKTQRAALKRIRAALKSFKPVREEIINYTKSGEEFWLEIEIAPVTDARGVFTHSISIERDITERKRTEAALILSNEEYQRQHSALVALTHGVLRLAGEEAAALQEITATVARALKVERASVWCFNADQTAIICQNLFEASADRHTSGQELQAGAFPSYFRALDEHEVIPADDARQDARTCEFTTSYLEPIGITSMLDAPVLVAGRLAGVLCIEHTGPCRQWTHGEQSFAVSVANIVSLMFSQRMHARSESRLRTIFESEPECVKIVSLEGRLLDMNPAGLHMIEADAREQVLGCRVSELVHVEDRQAFQDLHQRACQGATGQLEFRLYGCRGTGRWMETHSTPLREADGTISSVLSVTRDITERKQAEQKRLQAEAELRSSEATMALAQRIAHFGSWELDLTNQADVNANTLRWSDEMFCIAGFEPGSVKVTNQLFFQIVHPDDHQAIHDAVADAIRERREYSITHRLIWPDGETRIVHETAQIFFDEQSGLPLKMVGTTHDITEQRRAEEALRASEERFRTFMAHSPAAGWIVDADGRFRYLSPGYYRMFGVEAEDLTGRTVRDLYERSPTEVDIEKTFIALREYRVVETVEKGRRRDGSPGEFLVVRFPIIMSHGESLLGGIALDITERKLAEEKLREQAALLDKAQDAILVRDLSHCVRFWNRSAERLYEWTAAEALGRNVNELLYRDPAAFIAATEAVLTKGEWVGEIEQWTKSGKPIVVEGRWTLVRDDHGRPKSILAINTDITQSRRLEQQFLRAQRMEGIGTLAGGIAHDLNNVLAPIMMAIELLKMEEKNPKRLGVLNTIETSAKRGADMVKQVLSFARGVEGQKLEVHVGTLIREIKKIVNETFLKNIQVSSSIPENLWTVDGDSTQLHQVLLNLCVNARDAMPDGGTLMLSASNELLDEHFTSMNPDARPGPYVVVQVEDSGCGMTQEVINRMFDPFFTTKELGKGTGLGLSTTQAIVKSHGGFVRVYSEVGRGTKFWIYLPARAAAASGMAASAETELPRGNGELLLVVDDEEAVRQITQHTLETFGYRVMLASDGAEAMAIYTAHQKDIALVLTDMMMPVMDGPATIKALMSMNPGVRIIAASGLSANGMVAKAASVGVRNFLPKPYTAESMLRAIHEVLQE